MNVTRIMYLWFLLKIEQSTTWTEKINIQSTIYELQGWQWLNKLFF